MVNYTLTVNSSGASSVPIYSSTGHEGTTNYSHQVAAGTGVNLTAPSNSGGKVFSNWSGSISSTNQTISFSMSGDRTVTANTSTPSVKNDLLGTWDGQGVYYRNSDTGAWVKLATPATLIEAGDLDGDGMDDLIGIWPGQGGVWVKYSSTGSWANLSSTARDIAAGKMRGGAAGEGLIALDLPGPFGGISDAPFGLSDVKDLSIEGPGGLRFLWQEERNLIPHASSLIDRIPGPGEPGFRFTVQPKLFPGEDPTRDAQIRQDSEQVSRKHSD